MTHHSELESAFDQYAEEYEEALGQGLSITGEDKDYFAEGRVRWLKGCLKELKDQPRTIMDYGCGTGSTSLLFRKIIGSESEVGVDTSPKLLERARQSYGNERRQFFLIDQYQPAEKIDLVFCNGVFHHIPYQERAAAALYIHRSLRPGGVFAFWENNPWNPATRYVMSRIPFDRDAVTLSPAAGKRLLKRVGFEILRTDFLFVFPRLLKWLRWIEPKISRLPFGGQYQILCRKPVHRKAS
jgi:SAM-dependent methyltransferase